MARGYARRIVLVAIGLSVEFTGYLTKAFIADAFDKFLHEPVGKATSFSMPGSGRPSWEINLSTAIHRDPGPRG